MSLEVGLIGIKYQVTTMADMNLTTAILLHFVSSTPSVVVSLSSFLHIQVPLSLQIRNHRNYLSRPLEQEEC
ncbi:hypothetical protein P8452_25110 [Trifolium repens]|nr:hypothetical protein P8452_25110 [Trifolium repens]